MRIGLDHYTIAHRGLAPLQALAHVKSLGLDGLQFLEPSALAADLDPARLGEIRDQAAADGLYLEIGIPSPNPVRRSRAVGRTVEPDEHADALRREVEAAKLLGVRHIRAYIGDRHDRFRTDTPWATQLDASADVIRRLSPLLRDLGLRIAIETHADLTVAEILRLLDVLGTDTAGVTLDTGNLFMRLEDPLPAATRLAPYVLATHLKDAVVFPTDRGLAWQSRPLGSGLVPLPEILTLLARHHPDLALSIELHPRTYDLPIADPSWLAFFPDLEPGSVEAIVAHSRRAAGAPYNKEGIPLDPAAIEAISWPDREPAWVAQSAQFLRRMVEEIAPRRPPGGDQSTSRSLPS
ncbi:MAG: sugar phosphate isomerase/epimerase family protein [Isosphaeraceae bacterium]|nr:sugar phosphate isomerase/epimerase family protein [Isosphaeraceae bacterium]